MGLTAIRTVCKVDFDKPASEQPKLHVSYNHPSKIECMLKTNFLVEPLAS